MEEVQFTEAMGDHIVVRPKAKKQKPSKRRSGKQKRVQKSASETPGSLHALCHDAVRLDDSYGGTRLVLLPVEPYVVHVYWEATPEELEKAKDGVDEESDAVLRFYDVPNDMTDSMDAHRFFDEQVDLESKSRYVHLGRPERSCFVELGLKTQNGSFFPIARSNVVKTPRAWPASGEDEHDTFVQGDTDQGLLRRDTRTEHRKREKEAEPCSQPEPPFNQSAQAPSERRGDVELTEMSEKAFSFGVSSERGASSQKKNDSTEG